MVDKIRVDKILHYLQQVYPPHIAAQTADDLAQRIAHYQAANPHQPADPSAPFDQQDIVLITYGDTLHAHHEPPLKTLHRFAAQHLKGVFSTIHILPFYPYSSDDGFAVTDFYAVNPALGGWDDIARLREDFDLMFDGVFNHMSAQSDWFRHFLDGDPHYADLFYTESPDTDLSSVTRPRALPLLTAFQRPNGQTVHVWTTFSADQVDFDVRNPQTLLHLIDILLFYAEKGANIIRLDAICFLWKEPGTSCIHLPQTHAIIQLMRAVLDVAAPHVILITETNVPHQENISYFGDGTNEAQMVYNFTLPPLLFYTMLNADTRKLRDWVNTLKAPSPRTTFFNFTASHDGIGLRPIEGILDQTELDEMVAHVLSRGGRVSYRQNAEGTQSPYELNTTYLDAITDPAEPPALQVKRFIVSQAIAMSLAGVPAVYIHSLLGSHNDIEGMEQTGQNRTINRQKLPLDTVNATLDDPASFRAQVFNAYLHLLKHRADLPAFHPNAGQQALDMQNPAIFALMRTAPNGQRLLAVFNVSPHAQTLDISAALPAGGYNVLQDEQLSGKIQLPPYHFVWCTSR